MVALKADLNWENAVEETPFGSLRRVTEAEGSRCKLHIE